MEYGRIASHAWSITARTRPLWWLGAISACQVAVFAAVMGGLFVPMTVIPQVLTAPPASAGAALTPLSEQWFVTAAQWLGSHSASITVAVVVAFFVWVVFGVLDVAVQTGIVTQVDAVAEHRRASVGAGLRDGFRLWWRVVGLLALAALPSLVYALVMAIVFTATVTMPLFLGNQPDPAAVLVSNLAMTPLSLVVSGLSVPLGVLVQLGVRFGVLDDQEWRPAFFSAWRLVKTNVVEVVLTYALVALVTLLATVLFVVGALLCAAVLAALLLGIALVMTGGDTARAGGVALTGAAGSVALLFLAFEAVMFVWQSSVWTLVWRDRTGRRYVRNESGHLPETRWHAATPTTEGGP